MESYSLVFSYCSNVALLLCALFHIFIILVVVVVAAAVVAAADVVAAAAVVDAAVVADAADVAASAAAVVAVPVLCSSIALLVVVFNVDRKCCICIMQLTTYSSAHYQYVESHIFCLIVYLSN